MNWKLKCAVEREDDLYVSYCDDLNIASQGENVDEAMKNLVEAIEMFFEDASSTEILSLLVHLEPEAPVEIRQILADQSSQFQKDKDTQWELVVA